VNRATVQAGVDFTVTLVGTNYSAELVDFQITLDSSWTPYGQARLTLPLDPVLADAIDPTMSRDFVVAQVWLTRNLGDPTEQQHTFEFVIRGVTRNRTAGTMSVQCATNEAIAASFVWHESTAATFPVGMPVSAVVANVLNTAGAGALDFEHQEEFPTTYELQEEARWEVGVDAMSFLKPIVDLAGRKLVCDDRRRWLLIIPDQAVTLGPTAPRLYPADVVIELETREDLDRGHYATDVLVIYEWTDAGGTSHREIDVSLPSGAAQPRWHVERVDGARPGSGAATALQSRLLRWRAERTFRMAWDLELRPGIICAIREQDDSITEGKVHSVTYREDGTMDVVAAYEQYDTGWIDVETEDGFTPSAAYPPRVRRIGNVVYFEGGWEDDGLAASSFFPAVGVLPVGFTPPRNTFHAAAVNTQANGYQGRITFLATGTVQINTGPNLAAYYLATLSWLTS
jgi:hypothetical protein